MVELRKHENKNAQRSGTPQPLEAAVYGSGTGCFSGLRNPIFMKQYEAVIKVMEQNGGFATLGFLNQEVLKVLGVEWKTKTPFASIRRIVQDERFFFKIKPGLWALLSHKNKLPRDILSTDVVPKREQELFNHSYYQGLLVEVGKLKQYETFVPSQDKNKRFLGKTLGEISSQTDFHQFGYDHIVRKAKTIDVCWFNARKMPSTLFEVEHSTDIQNSLLKFVELQDFNTKFFIVADKARKAEYKGKIELNAFVPIKARVQFMDYDVLSELHTKTFEIAGIENSINF